MATIKNYILDGGIYIYPFNIAYLGDQLVGEVDDQVGVTYCSSSTVERYLYDARVFGLSMES